jgi:hypothetical protein
METHPLNPLVSSIILLVNLNPNPLVAQTIILVTNNKILIVHVSNWKQINIWLGATITIIVGYTTPTQMFGCHMVYIVLTFWWRIHKINPNPNHH